MVEGKIMVLVLLDFRKSFDLVDHSLFLYKLLFHLLISMVPRGIWCPHFCLTFRWLLLRWMVGGRPHVHCFLVCLRAGYLHHYFFSFVNCLSELIRHSKFHFYYADMTCKSIYREIVVTWIV
jgi:hypothetical protein